MPGALVLCAGPPDDNQHTRIVELFRSARAAEQKQEFSQATERYGEIVKLDSSIAEVWSNLGMALYRLDKNSEAIIAFGKAAALKPSLLAPHLFAGLAYLKMGLPQKAIAPLETAVALDPKEPEARLGLADAYARTKQFGPAVRLYNRILEQDPASEEAAYRLASTYMDWAETIGLKLKDSPTVYGKLVKDQVESVRKARPSEEEGGSIALLEPREFDAASRSRDPGYQYRLYRTCQALAAATLKRTIDAHPNSWHAHLLLANLALQQSEYDTAGREYRTAVALNRRDPEVRLIYIRFLETAHDEPRALLEARQAMADFPTHPALNFHLGKLELNAGNAARAKACFARSLEADPHNTFAVVGLADSYAALGKTELAIRVIQPVLASDSDGSLHYRLARWYQRSGHPQKAAAEFAATKRIREQAHMAQVERFARSLKN